jgi:hypothetical protein
LSAEDDRSEGSQRDWGVDWCRTCRPPLSWLVPCPSCLGK